MVKGSHPQLSRALQSVPGYNEPIFSCFISLHLVLLVAVL